MSEPDAWLQIANKLYLADHTLYALAQIIAHNPAVTPPVTEAADFITVVSALHSHWHNSSLRTAYMAHLNGAAPASPWQQYFDIQDIPPLYETLCASRDGYYISLENHPFFNNGFSHLLDGMVEEIRAAVSSRHFSAN